LRKSTRDVFIGVDLFSWLHLEAFCTGVHESEKCVARSAGAHRYDRGEVLAAFTNAAFLLFEAFSTCVEALHTLIEPPEERNHHHLVVVAVTSLLVNLLGVLTFRKYAHLNITYRTSQVIRPLQPQTQTLYLIPTASAPTGSVDRDAAGVKSHECDDCNSLLPVLHHTSSHPSPQQPSENEPTQRKPSPYIQRDSLTTT